MFKPAFPSLSLHPYREWERDLLFDADRAPLFAVAALCMFGRDLLGAALLDQHWAAQENSMKSDSATQTVSYGRRAASYWFVDGLPELCWG